MIYCLIYSLLLQNFFFVCDRYRHCCDRHLFLLATGSWRSLSEQAANCGRSLRRTGSHNARVDRGHTTVNSYYVTYLDKVKFSLRSCGNEKQSFQASTDSFGRCADQLAS